MTLYRYNMINSLRFADSEVVSITNSNLCDRSKLNQGET